MHGVILNGGGGGNLDQSFKSVTLSTEETLGCKCVVN